MNNNSLYFVYNRRADAPEQTVEILIPDIIPENVSYSYQPQFQEQGLLGRRSPVFLYTGGSAKSYSFNLSLHEDILSSVQITENGTTFTPSSIIELIDRLKMLAYPIIDISGTTRYPQMYFELGELAGYGIVSIDVSWKKPFRNARYINADVSFNITVEEEIEMPTEPETRSQETSFEDIVYDYKISLNLSQAEAERLVEGLGPAYQGSVEDFIRENDVSQAALNIKEELAIENYDYQVQRINSVFGLFKENAGEEVDIDLEIFEAVNSFSYETLYTEDETEAEQIKDLKDAFRDYLDYYYDDVSTDMTRDEYYQVLDSIFTALENLQKFAEEIYGYGQSS